MSFSPKMLFEGASVNSRHPGHRAWGREAPSSGPLRRFAGIRGIAGIAGRVPKSMFWSNTPILLAKVELSCDVFCVFTFSWASQLKHLLLRAFFG